MNSEELQALRASIRHWCLDIKRPLSNAAEIAHVCDWSSRGDKLFWKKSVDGTSSGLVPCYARHCKLCNMFTRTDGTFNIIFLSCTHCPLGKWQGGRCGKANTSWRGFINNPCLETCKEMIKTLVACYWHVCETNVGRTEVR